MESTVSYLIDSDPKGNIVWDGMLQFGNENDIQKRASIYQKRNPSVHVGSLDHEILGQAFRQANKTMKWGVTLTLETGETVCLGQLREAYERAFGLRQYVVVLKGSI